jgi:hypothetical protein
MSDTPPSLAPQPSASADDEWLVRWIADRDVGCPVCGYNLRAVPVATCPECGGPLRLSVTSTRIRLGPWLTAVIAFSLATGFDAVVTVLMLIPILLEGVPRSVIPMVAVLFGTIAGLGIASGSGIAWLIVKRGSWNRLSYRRQWIDAVAIFAIVFVVHGIVGLVIAGLYS